MDEIGFKDFDLMNKTKEIGGLDEIPDGGIVVNKASKYNLDFKLSINDQKYY